MIIDDSLCLGVDRGVERGVSARAFRGVYGKVNMSKVEYV